MKQELFVDTGAWYALQVTTDRWHVRVAEAFRSISSRGLRLTTTNLVIGETYTLLRTRHGRSDAFRFLDHIDAATYLVRTAMDETVEREAYTLLRRFADHDFSFVDATSFVVMRGRRARFALALDKHFVTAGFTRVPIDAAVP